MPDPKWDLDLIEAFFSPRHLPMLPRRITCFVSVSKGLDMEAFKLNITESGFLGTPRDQKCPGSSLVLVSFSLALEGPR